MSGKLEEICQGANTFSCICSVTEPVVPLIVSQLKFLNSGELIIVRDAACLVGNNSIHLVNAWSFVANDASASKKYF